MNKYSVPLKYLVHLDSHLNFKFEGKIKLLVSYILLGISYSTLWRQYTQHTDADKNDI
jgi:hypothetical protein